MNVALAAVNGASLDAPAPLAAAAVLGFASYGVSLVLFVRALRDLGTARTGAYFSTAPFAGALLSILVLHAKTPREVVDRLNAEVNELLELPEIRAALAMQGLTAVTDKPGRLALEMNARMQFQSIVLAGDQGHIVFMDDAEVQANVSWQNYERSWNLWKTRALARLEAEKAAAA